MGRGGGANIMTHPAVGKSWSLTHDGARVLGGGLKKETRAPVCLRYKEGPALRLSYEVSLYIFLVPPKGHPVYTLTNFKKEPYIHSPKTVI